MAAWTGEIEPLLQMSVQELDMWRQSGYRVLDVRSDAEWAEGYIADAHDLFAGDIAQGVTPNSGFAPGDHIAVICGSGYRSSVASSILQAGGYEHLVNVEGGMNAWKDAHLPVT